MKIDPVLTFGKNRGTALSQVETAYIRWMAEQNPPVKIGTKDWTDLAKKEYLRRKLGADLPEGLELVELSLSSEATAKVGPFVLNSRDNLVVAIAAVDFASLFLLREFILRSDKTQGMSSWLRSIALEAWNYGVPIGENRLYHELYFLFEELSLPPAILLWSITKEFDNGEG